jgi:hypothetical protein
VRCRRSQPPLVTSTTVSSWRTSTLCAVRANRALIVGFAFIALAKYETVCVARAADDTATLAAVTISSDSNLMVTAVKKALPSLQVSCITTSTGATGGAATYLCYSSCHGGCLYLLPFPSSRERSIQHFHRVASWIVCSGSKIISSTTVDDAVKDKTVLILDPIIGRGASLELALTVRRRYLLIHARWPCATTTASLVCCLLSAACLLCLCV